MAAVPKTEEDDYNSSSDEDYDPEKDDGTDGEVDEDEEDVEETEEVEKPQLKPEPVAPPKTEKSVDEIFQELTGMKPATTTSSEAPTTTVYPKTAAPPAPTPTTSKPTPVYPSKPSIVAAAPGRGQKRSSLLDAAKSMKRGKTSVLDKSDSDWKAFKTEQNIKEDLESHNRGKGGYLNKMDFLNRTDNRQFEKERALRATARKDQK